MDPTRTVALCRTADGTRCVAMSDDAALAAHGIVDELVGARVRVVGGRFDLGVSRPVSCPFPQPVR